MPKLPPIPKGSLSPFPKPSTAWKIELKKTGPIKFEDYTMEFMPKREPMRHEMITQKARGLHFLQNNFHLTSAFVKSPFNMRGENDGVYFIPLTFPDAPRFPMFARPCPLEPRHGFVESRVVYNMTDIFRTWREAITVDPYAELILMPVYTGDYSAVANNAGITWGPGNAGVTSGNSGSQVFIPAPSTVDDWNRDWYGAGIKTCAFFEIVENKGETVLVQVRDGPALPVDDNFIPEDVVIEKVIVFEFPGDNDLLAWEKKIKAAYSKYGKKAALYLGGFALSSHHAVHGIQLGMPVICKGSKPKVGLEIKATSRRTIPLKKKDLLKIKEALDFWERVYIPDGITGRSKLHKNLLLTAIGSVHAMPSWDNRDLLLNFRAMAAMFIARYTAAGCIGEARHWYGSGPGRSGKAPSIDWEEVLGFSVKVNCIDRGEVYKTVLIDNLASMKKITKAAAEDLNAEGWRSGMGGRSWANSANSAVDLIEAIENFRKRPTSDNWTETALVTNRCLNAAHNNGKVLDKWVDNYALNKIASTPAYGFFNPMAARIALYKDFTPKCLMAKEK